MNSILQMSKLRFWKVKELAPAAGKKQGFKLSSLCKQDQSYVATVSGEWELTWTQIYRDGNVHGVLEKGLTKAKEPQEEETPGW